MTSRTRLRLFSGLSLLALGGLAWLNRRWFTVHDITTGESTAYPTLRSRVYYADPAAVLTVAAQAISLLPRWHVVQVDDTNMALDAQAQSLLPGLTHSVTLYLHALGGGQTRVIIRAHSRPLPGDLGQNAVLIRQIQAALDQHLTRDAAI